MWLTLLSGRTSSWGSSIKVENYAIAYLSVINVKQILNNYVNLLTFYACFFWNSCSNIRGMSNIGPSLGTTTKVNTWFSSMNTCRASRNTYFSFCTSNGIFFCCVSRTLGCPYGASWSAPIATPPLIMTTILGSFDSMKIFCIFVLAFVRIFRHLGVS